MSTEYWVASKDPDDVKDYDIDWSARLGTDTIITSTWIMPSGTLVKDSDTHTTTVTKIWLSGGAAKANYSLVNRITTTGGRTYDKTAGLRVRTR